MKIEDLQAHCVEQMRRLPKTSKMYEEHLLTLAVIDTNKKYFDEIEKRDKIIDLMAEFIFQNIDVEEDICDSAYVECTQETSQDITCINCIKQYFERNVENESND